MRGGELGDNGGDTSPLLEAEEDVDDADREPDGEARGDEPVLLRNPLRGLSSTESCGIFNALESVTGCSSISSSESA
jgi:hypothetical protein